MKKTILYVTAMTLCAASPALANMKHGKDGDHKAMQDHMFNKLDTNGDGVVSKEENDAFAQKMFTEADANGDGKVTKDEMSAYHMKKKEEMKTTLNDRVVTSDDAKTNSNSSTTKNSTSKY